MKKLKDSDLEVTVDKKISELKNLSMKKKVQSMAIWSKFVRGNPNNKHSGVSSEDVDEEEAAAIPVITASAENSSQSSSSYDSPTDLQQAVSTSNEKAKPMPKQDDLRKKIETEADILLGLCRKREYDMCSQQWITMNSKKEKKKKKKKKLENKLKVAENNRL